MPFQPLCNHVHHLKNCQPSQPCSQLGRGRLDSFFAYILAHSPHEQDKCIILYFKYNTLDTKSKCHTHNRTKPKLMANLFDQAGLIPHSSLLASLTGLAPASFCHRSLSKAALLAATRQVRRLESPPLPSESGQQQACCSRHGLEQKTERAYAAGLRTLYGSEVDK